MRHPKWWAGSDRQNETADVAPSVFLLLSDIAEKTIILTINLIMNAARLRKMTLLEREIKENKEKAKKNKEKAEHLERVTDHVLAERCRKLKGKDQTAEAAWLSGEGAKIVTALFRKHNAALWRDLRMELLRIGGNESRWGDLTEEEKNDKAEGEARMLLDGRNAIDR